MAKCFLRFLTESRVSVMAPVTARPSQDTGHALAGPDFLERRPAAHANIHRVLAARSEAAADGRVQQARHRAGDRLETVPVLGGAVDARDRADQALRVGMPRLAEPRLARRLL